MFEVYVSKEKDVYIFNIGEKERGEERGVSSYLHHWDKQELR